MEQSSQRSSDEGVGRRGLLRAGGLGAVGLGTAVAAGTTAAHAAPPRPHGRGWTDRATGVSTKPALRFGMDGRFTILQFNDTQDGADTDRRTLEFMRRAIEQEDPGLVVLVGDQLTDAPKTAQEQKQALNNIIRPMEDAGAPWALTFGNHDEDATERTGFGEPQMLEFIQQYEHNRNVPGAPAEVTGTGNMNLLIGDSRSNAPAFGVWLMDAGRYAPEQIAGQDFEGYPDWDWLRADQVRWYLEASEMLEQQLGTKVPSLMYTHIALWEHRFMWWASVDSREEADHERALAKHSIVGERNEDECPGPFNSGLYSALQHRGDVRGVYVGHDHTNTYMGDYYGIQLGYSPGTGFGPYGLGGERKHRNRGARVFELDERVEGLYAGTRLVFARELGIDLSVAKQPVDAPLEFPRGVR